MMCAKKIGHLHAQEKKRTEQFILLYSAYQVFTETI